MPEIGTKGPLIEIRCKDFSVAIAYYLALFRLEYSIKSLPRLGFRFIQQALINNRYQPAPLTQGRLLVPELELSLGLWQGVYRSIDLLWLRWMTLAGEVVDLDVDNEELNEAKKRIIEQRERIIEERERAIAAEEERIEAEERIIQERERAIAAEEEKAKVEEQNEQLRAMLLEMGVDPEQLP